MNISVKGSRGVFAQCPRCQLSIPHGFQICLNCGHTVSAEQQQSLRNLLKRNVVLHVTFLVMGLGVILGIAYKLFR